MPAPPSATTTSMVTSTCSCPAISDFNAANPELKTCEYRGVK